jgi:hypothetical protein
MKTYSGRAGHNVASLHPSSFPRESNALEARGRQLSHVQSDRLVTKHSRVHAQRTRLCMRKAGGNSMVETPRLFVPYCVIAPRYRCREACRPSSFHGQTLSRRCGLAESGTMACRPLERLHRREHDDGRRIVQREAPPSKVIGPDVPRECRCRVAGVKI